jgi:hypothetical protein
MQELYLFMHIFMHIIMREALLYHYIILRFYVIIYLQIAHPYVQQGKSANAGVWNSASYKGLVRIECGPKIKSLRVGN